MKGIVKPIIMITAAGAVIYAAGCAPVKVQSFEEQVDASFEMMRNPVAKKIQANTTSNPVEAAEKVLLDTIAFYKSDVASDGMINVEGDVTKMTELADRVAALWLNPLVKEMKGDKYTPQCINAAEHILTGLVNNYQSEIDENVFFVVAVEALSVSAGKQNYGWTNPRGGYLVEGSMEDAKYAIWAAMCTEKAGSGRAYPLEAKIARLKRGVNEAGKYPFDAIYVASQKDKREQAEAIVKNISERTVTSDPRPLRGAKRDAYSTHLNGRQAVGLVYSLSNPADRGWQAQGIQQLFSNVKADDRKMVGQEEGVGVIAIVPGAVLKDSIKQNLDTYVKQIDAYIARNKK